MHYLHLFFGILLSGSFFFCMLAYIGEDNLIYIE